MQRLTRPSIPPLLSPPSNRAPLLYPTGRTYSRFMGPHHLESRRPRGHVLVLLPERSRNQSLMEGVDHPHANCTIRHRSR